ncbi:PepSY domain-containing protein, partial [Burkholderia sola]
WLQQMALAAMLYALLPLLNVLTGGASLVHTMANGQWSIASFELLMLGLAAIHGVVAWWLLRGKPATAATSRAQARAASQAPTLERAS